LQRNSNFKGFVILSPATIARFRCNPNIPKSFEILIFFSLDSNDAGALYTLRADTVFRAVQAARWIEQTVRYRSACVFRRTRGIEVPEKDKIGTGPLAVSRIPCLGITPWPVAGKHLRSAAK
jgi:hypothetical protein